MKNIPYLLIAIRFLFAPIIFFLAYLKDEESRFKLYLERPEIFNAYTELAKKHNYCLGINGAVFTRESVGIIPRLVKEYSKAKSVSDDTFSLMLGEKEFCFNTKTVSPAFDFVKALMNDKTELNFKICLN